MRSSTSPRYQRRPPTSIDARKSGQSSAGRRHASGPSTRSAALRPGAWRRRVREAPDPSSQGDPVAALDGEIESSWTHERRLHHARDLGRRTPRVPGGIPLRHDRRSATAARETFAAIPMFSPGTTDRPVTLRAMRRFLLWCAIVSRPPTRSGCRSSCSARTMPSPRAQTPSSCSRARQPAVGRTDACRRRDRAGPVVSAAAAAAATGACGSAARSRRMSSASTAPSPPLARRRR